MRRLLLACLLAVMVGVPVLAGTARAASTRTILQDCDDDSRLEGSYSVADLQKARKNLGADQDEYSDCRDVLTRAISAAAAKANAKRSGTASAAPSASATAIPSGSGGDAGRGSGGSGGSGSGQVEPGDDGAAPEATATATPDPTPAPVTAAELDAAARAAQQAGRPSVTVDGRRVLAGSSGLAPDAVVNALPTSLLVVLISLVAAGVAAILPAVRRRVLRRHRPE